VPVYVSVGVVGSRWVFDLSLREEHLCRSKLVFGVGLNGTDGTNESGGGVRGRKTQGAAMAAAIRRVFSAKSASLEYGATMDDVMEAACLAGKRLLAALDAAHQQADDDTRAFHIGI